MRKDDLLKDAKDGILSIELLPEGVWGKRVNFGGDICVGPPKCLAGVCKVTGADDEGIIYKRSDDKETLLLPVGPELLVEYTGYSLLLYAPGYREPTADEKSILAEWSRFSSTPEYKELARIDVMSDGSECFYVKERFFEERHMEYLTGWGSRNSGSRLDLNRVSLPDCISDEHIRGDLALSYRVYRREVA